MTERSPRWARVRAGSGGGFPRPVRCPARERVLLPAQPGARRPLQELGTRGSKSQRRSQGRGVLAGDSLGWKVIFAPLGKCRTLGNRRKMSVWRDLSAAWRERPHGQSGLRDVLERLQPSTWVTASPFLQWTLARDYFPLGFLVRPCGEFTE